MREGAVAESEVILKHLEQMNNEADIIEKDRGEYKKNRKSCSVCFKEKPPESMNYKTI